ncbi:nuclear receptor corepressor 2-like isoform X2 [Leptonychotes weddellii]|uniref:Nuclear receptor corepressor 2-like isoform X2 n=1 Tax=Leptonychotes weddellii TaxID=9713 RepID=A0A7F8RJ04_LEPWE|nr:nuclear receptor corepressor 2-like isoform X2 [Leptonychotes weddellii]
MRKKLILYFKRRNHARKQWEQKFCQRYDQLMEAWEKKVERIENNPRRRAKESKVREYYEKQFPEIRKQRELQERMQRVGQRGSGLSMSAARSEHEVSEIIDGLSEQEVSFLVPGLGADGQSPRSDHPPGWRPPGRTPSPASASALSLFPWAPPDDRSAAWVTLAVVLGPRDDQEAEGVRTMSCQPGPSRVSQVKLLTCLVLATQQA